MTYEEWQSNQRAVPDPALAALISIRHGSNFVSALITLLGNVTRHLGDPRRSRTPRALPTRV
jgi:hypothetical protein